MNPFAGLAAAVTRRPVVEPNMRGNTKTARALHLIECNSSLSTRELCDAMDMTSRHVWGRPSAVARP